MKVLVVDMTHGGTVIASEFSRMGFDVFALDIYHTLKEDAKNLLTKNGVKLVQSSFLKDLSENNGRNRADLGINGMDLPGNETGRKNLESGKKAYDLLVVLPVHCNFESEINSAGNLKIKKITHHEAVGFLLKNRINVPVIEITGVKGKTSVCWMLKEIFKDLNPLILSSLGVEVIKNKRDRTGLEIGDHIEFETGGQAGIRTHDEKSDVPLGNSQKEDLILKKNISITPASIIEAFKLVNSCENLQECSMNDEVGMCIFETSLGGTGLADVGVLTNVAENYPIAGGKRRASQAKAQIFKSKMVACEYQTFNSFYSNPRLNLDSVNSSPVLKLDSNNSEYINLDKKTNTFGFEKDANVRVSSIQFGLYRTTIHVTVEDLKTIDGNILNTSFEVSTFAPAHFHVQNVLAVICASLTLGTSVETVKRGLENFRGVEGRTSIKDHEGSMVIEEINPGLNVTAVKNALNMVSNLERAGVVFGGKYGVTCEEIDEKSVSDVLNNLDDSIPLVLVDELGNNVKNNMKRDFRYLMSLNDAVGWAHNAGCEKILVIYRSNFSDLNLR